MFLSDQLWFSVDIINSNSRGFSVILTICFATSYCWSKKSFHDIQTLLIRPLCLLNASLIYWLWRVKGLLSNLYEPIISLRHGQVSFRNQYFRFRIPPQLEFLFCKEAQCLYLYHWSMVRISGLAVSSWYNDIIYSISCYDDQIKLKG